MSKLSTAGTGKTRLVGMTSGAVIAAAALTVACWSGSGIAMGQNEPAKPAARSGSISPIVIERCRIKLIDEVVIASGRTGVLGFVEPREGDMVRKDQQVAGLMDDVPRAAFSVAEKEASNDIEVRYALKAAEVAQAEFAMSRDINNRVKKTVPEMELEKLRPHAERGVLQTAQAEHQFEIAKLKKDEAAAGLKLFRIEAPFDGVVTRVYKNKGEAVREGDPILEVCNTNRVKVEGNLSIRDWFSVQPGAKVRVQLDIEGVDLEVEKKVFEGKVIYVDVKVQPVTNEIRVWAEVPNPENILRAGATARMTIFPNAPTAAAKANGAIAAPVAAKN